MKNSLSRTFFPIAFCMVLAPEAFSQARPVAPRARPQQTIKLNHLAYYVHDLQKSTDFYEQVLALKQIPEPFKDGAHTWFDLDGKAQLHLIQGAAPNLTREKRTHICFSVSDMEAFIANLDKRNIAYENLAGEVKKITNRPDGVKQLYLQDPDGYWVEINNDGYTKKAN